MFCDGETVIGDKTPLRVAFGDRHGFGLVPRDFGAYPEGYLSPPAQLKPIDQSEWAKRAKDQLDGKSRLSDIRDTIKSLNQNPAGYCWGHSTTHTVILDRELKKLPRIDLSAYMVCAIIKRGRDEGGWCGLSAEFMSRIGICSQSYWPQQQFSLSLDTPEMRANAGLHKIVEGWTDFSKPLWDQQLSFAQVITLLLCNVPCALDFNWWGHSVCGCDAVDGSTQMSSSRGESGKLLNLREFEDMWGLDNPLTAGWGIRIWNSWGDGWSQRGMGVLTGQKAIPNGAIATTSTYASAA